MGDSVVKMNEQSREHADPGPVSMWLSALRIPHWIKSGFCLAALFFHGSALEVGAWLAVLPIVVCFCLVSSAVYLANDIVNRGEDCRHPRKRRRPIASGQISVRRGAHELFESFCRAQRDAGGPVVVGFWVS